MIDMTVEPDEFDSGYYHFMMSSCLDLPRERHLQQIYYIFTHLDNKHNTEFVFGSSVNNQSVLANITAPDSQLKNKSIFIAYHNVNEGIARDEQRTTYVRTYENPADLLIKAFSPSPKRDAFCCMLLHHIFDQKELPSDPAETAAALSVSKEIIWIIVTTVAPWA